MISIGERLESLLKAAIGKEDPEDGDFMRLVLFLDLGTGNITRFEVRETPVEMFKARPVEVFTFEPTPDGSGVRYYSSLELKGNRSLRENSLEDLPWVRFEAVIARALALAGYHGVQLSFSRFYVSPHFPLETVVGFQQETAVVIEYVDQGKGVLPAPLLDFVPLRWNNIIGFVPLSEIVKLA